MESKNDFQKTICLIVDHPNRDLKGVALIAAELTLNGFRCILTPLNLCNHETWKFIPDLVHLPYLRNNNAEFAKKLKKANILFTVLDSEGGVLEDLSTLEKLLPDDKSTIAECSHFFCWGEPQKNFYVSNLKIPEKIVSATGQPRIDFYFKEFQSSLLNNEILKIGKYFLFNSMFSFSNPKYSTRERELLNAMRMFGYNRAYLEKIQSDEIKAQKNFIELTLKVSMKFSHIKIIFRPHPFEAHDIYQTAFKGYENIIISNELQVDSWIYHSLAVVQLKCSTAFESRMLGKQVLLPIWIGNLEGDDRINQISHIIETEEIFFETISKILKDEYSTPNEILKNQQEIIESIYYKQDGQAHVRVAQLIIKAIENKNFSTSIEKCISSKSQFSINPKENIVMQLFKFILIRTLISNALIKFKILEQISVLKWKKTSKFYNKEMVSHVLKELEKANPKFKNILAIKANSKDFTNQSIELITTSSS